MAKITDLEYSPVVAKSIKAIALCDLGKRFETFPIEQLCPILVDLVPKTHLDELIIAKSLNKINVKSVEEKKTLIKNAFELHKSAGVPNSVIRVLNIMGFTDVILIEGNEPVLRNGSVKRAKLVMRGSLNNWAFYKIIINDVNITEVQAKGIADLVQYFAPQRSILASINEFDLWRNQPVLQK